MKRPKPLRADAQRNRAHLLVTAREVFATRGLAVPIDAIAEKAGVGIGTIYRHFPTKEALFEAIIVDRLESLVTEARQLSSASDPASALLTFLGRMVSEGAAKKDLVEALSGSGVDVHRGLMLGVAQDLRQALGALLDRAQEAGTIRSDVGVEEVLAMVRGAFAASHGYPGGEKARARLSAMLFDGLRRIAVRAEAGSARR